MSDEQPHLTALGNTIYFARTLDVEVFRLRVAELRTSGMVARLACSLALIELLAPTSAEVDVAVEAYENWVPF